MKQVDDYYQTNDESIDFMVNSRGKKKVDGGATTKQIRLQVDKKVE